MTNIQTATRTKRRFIVLKKVLNVILVIIKFIWNIVKHVFLLPLYCSLPDKYGGITYTEWLNDNNDKKE